MRCSLTMPLRTGETGSLVKNKAKRKRRVCLQYIVMVHVLNDVRPEYISISTKSKYEKNHVVKLINHSTSVDVFSRIYPCGSKGT